jgi:hypothetical protein
VVSVLRYLQSVPSYILPDLSFSHTFKAVVISEAILTTTRQAEISEWLVLSGCLYMMAWGEECRAWQDAVNLANLKAYEFAQIPDDQLVITTSHPDEQLQNVFWFCKHTAMHPCHDLDNTVLLHLGEQNRETEYTDEFIAA